jgi:hypothetical protein
VVNFVATASKKHGRDGTFFGCNHISSTLNNTKGYKLEIDLINKKSPLFGK